MVQEMTIIGEVVSTFGVKGFVKVYPYTDFIDRIYALEKVYVVQDDRQDWKVIEESSIHQERFWLLKLRDCTTKDEAEKYRGALLKIMPHQRVPLPEGHFYMDQIIGLQVWDSKNDYLGKVSDIIRTGSNDVYLVRGETPETKEILIPALKSIIKQIDLDNQKMFVELPNGLLKE